MSMLDKFMSDMDATNIRRNVIKAGTNTVSSSLQKTYDDFTSKLATFFTIVAIIIILIVIYKGYRWLTDDPPSLREDGPVKEHEDSGR